MCTHSQHTHVQKLGKGSSGEVTESLCSHISADLVFWKSTVDFSLFYIQNLEIQIIKLTP